MLALNVLFIDDPSLLLCRRAATETNVTKERQQPSAAVTLVSYLDTRNEIGELAVLFSSTAIVRWCHIFLQKLFLLNSLTQSS